MARQFDNSHQRFARPTTGAAYYVIAAAAVVLVFSVLVASIVSRSWLLAGISAFATLAVLGWMAAGAQRHRRTVADKAAGRIAWEPVQPELQRQTLNVAVGEISQIMQVQPEAVGELQTAFIVGEDLALRQIQQEENVPVMRHISVGGVPFDAAFTKDEILVCCEVCFVVSAELGQDRVAAMMRKIAAVKRAVAEMNIGLEVRLMVILVTQMAAADVEKLRETLSTKRFSSTPVDIDIRLMDFEGLQRIYVLS
ncbi:MAG: hypothetical protein ABIR33_04710 [Pyrinomonadaceae bacterium]